MTLWSGIAAVHLMGSLGEKSRADHARNDDRESENSECCSWIHGWARAYRHPLRTMLSSQAAGLALQAQHAKRCAEAVSHWGQTIAKGRMGGGGRGAW